MDSGDDCGWLLKKLRDALGGKGEQKRSMRSVICWVI